MANTKSRPDDPGAARHEPTDSTPPRPVHRRRSIVSRRAVLGGLLVAVAMVGTFAASSTANDEPADRVLLVRHAVRAGEPLTADDVTEERAALPADAKRAALASAAELTGAVALSPLQAGDILQRSAVLLADETDPSLPSGREFSLPVERDRALNGDLAPGETVDVLATYGTGESAYTVVVARRARVVDVAETSGGLGSDGRIVITLALDDADAVLRAAHASVAAAVTVTRSTRAPRGESADRYSTAEHRPGENGTDENRPGEP